MDRRTLVDPVTLDVGTMPRDRLLEVLREKRVQLNESAEVLLDDPIFDRPEPESVTAAHDRGLALTLYGARLPLSPSSVADPFVIPAVRPITRRTAGTAAGFGRRRRD